uniref:Transmembrane protein n=1 Tax=Physcomitrium patens TaxID=3218 RepID=A0A2K1KFX8_PHYPA|nr:hypothetical protein PHYPA_009055 [Physcomitrium patens]
MPRLLWAKVVNLRRSRLRCVQSSIESIFFLLLDFCSYCVAYWASSLRRKLLLPPLRSSVIAQEKGRGLLFFFVVCFVLLVASPFFCFFSTRVQPYGILVCLEQILFIICIEWLF